MNLPLSDIHAAADFLGDKLGPSPLVDVERWHTAAGSPIIVKAENLLPTGSFKIRGATWRVAILTPDECARGVIAYSTGNHAQAVAKAAADAGIRATIVMSPDVPRAKIEATEAWGRRSSWRILPRTRGEHWPKASRTGMAIPSSHPTTIGM